MSDDKFLQEQSKEQLIIFLHNAELHIEDLRNRLFKLTGCKEFGRVDGVDGSCIDCLHENIKLFNKCWNFKLQYKKS